MLRFFLLLVLSSAATDAATVFTGGSAPSTTGGAMLRRELVGSSPDTTGPKGGLVIEKKSTEEQDSKRWRLGLHYFQGTTNSIGEILTGQWDTVTQNGIRLTAGTVLVEDLWDWPVDIIAEGGIMWHDEKRAQPDLFQWTLAVKLEWKQFPWSSHLRTRFGVGTGLSYAEHIPTAEILNRHGRSSKHLLNYLEFSLAFNCADITCLVGLDRLFTSLNPQVLDGVWLVGSTPHRSGAWGLYGNDNTGHPIQSGSNYLSIGIETEF